MAEKKRLSKIAKELNVGLSTIEEFLTKKGFAIDSNPNTKIDEPLYEMLVKEYGSDSKRFESEKQRVVERIREKKESVSIDDVHEESDEVVSESEDVIIIQDHTSKNKTFDEDETKNQKKEPVKATSPESEIPVHTSETDIETEQSEALKTHVDDSDEDETDLISNDDQDQDEEEEYDDDSDEDEEEGDLEEEDTTEHQPANEETEMLTEAIAQPETSEPGKREIKVVGKIDLSSINQRTRPVKKTKKQREDERKERSRQDKLTREQSAPKKITPTPPVIQEEVVRKDKPVKDDNFIETSFQKLSGPTVVGKIELPVDNDSESDKKRKKKRKRKKLKETTPVKSENEVTPVRKEAPRTDSAVKKVKKKTRLPDKPEITTEDVDKQIKETYARLSAVKQQKKLGAKFRRQKRQEVRDKIEEEMERQEMEKSILKVTEFVSVSELSNMMSVSVTELISTCMSLGLFVSINQRLDAETMSVLAEEYGFKVEFVSVEVQEAIKEAVDTDEQLLNRPPIVTVMGHVDHGKTSLLDTIRSTNVIAGEAGGITQHIGAYKVSLANGRQLTFLDTPGHEAFTAMRARGAQVTDITIIVVAADDSVMPQTIEAINHAQAAGVPIVFAINKVDKPGANPERIKEQLANMNLLVEDWGGKYQSQEISAKFGKNVDLLLDKVLFEAELLDLKANPNKAAKGTVIESSLDKGRGYVSTVLVEAGTLRKGDVVLAGGYFGKVKAMFNERGKEELEAGPSEPVLILGLNGAPQAGDRFNVLDSEREAREIATKRQQLQREQGIRARKYITLDEIGRRIAIGNFKELNIIVKGDVDGSIEALSDSLLKLSNNEVQVNVIHKGVGQISETDVMLAAASDAVIVGFQVRPSVNARRLAEKEGIDIRLYSIIYDAINEIKAAIEGMLSPVFREEITGTAEAVEVFKITKVGTVAGCVVREGKIHRSTQVRIIRDGIVIYTGNILALKRFKEDVKEVNNGYECGISIDKYNDLKVGDLIEAFAQVEVKKP